MGRSLRTVEWTVWDERQGDFLLVRARTQKEAVRRAVDRGYLPKVTHDCRPRTGDRSLMGKDEYREWLDQNFNY